jgi:hypothetical protein
MWTEDGRPWTKQMGDTDVDIDMEIYMDMVTTIVLPVPNVME